MDYTTLIKKLVLPAGFAPPALLVYDDIEARAITREHLSDDVRGINASLELIRRTRGGGWPEEAVTEEFCNTIRRYRITKVTGDRYAAEWPREQFRKRGVVFPQFTQLRHCLYLRRRQRRFTPNGLMAVKNRG